MDSLSNVRLERSSVTMPMPVFTMITNPNTASFHEPVSNTSSMAPRMMPLNRVNTLARMMSLIERDDDVFIALPCPSA